VKQSSGALPPPPKAKPQGSASNVAPPQGAPPSQGWKQLKGQSFSISYPGTWQVFGDQQSSMVTIAPREGVVQGRDGHAQIGYGVMMSYYDPRGQNDLRSATKELVNQLRANNPTMQPGSRAERTAKVAGAEALITMLQSSSPYGGTESDAIVTLSRPEGLFYFVFVAPEKNFGELEGTFTKMLDSLRFS
jgi:hypothetical protein